jgi:hypothetical protein
MAVTAWLKPGYQKEGDSSCGTATMNENGVTAQADATEVAATGRAADCPPARARGTSAQADVWLQPSKGDFNRA